MFWFSTKRGQLKPLKQVGISFDWQKTLKSWPIESLLMSIEALSVSRTCITLILARVVSKACDQKQFVVSQSASAFVHIDGALPRD